MSHPTSVPIDPTAFFGFSVSRAIAAQIFGPRLVSLGTTAVVIATNPRRQSESEMHLPDRVSLAAYPASVDALLSLLMDRGEDREARDRLEIVIPWWPFVELAGQVGADNVTDLALSVGTAANDPIMKALRECFKGLRALASRSGDALAERLVDALNTHLAEQYGGMRKQQSGPNGGGLAPWQLRAARRALDDLHSIAPLDEIARECGLSGGHFARAFKRSTGKSPHQWVVLRRIEAAKEMLGGGMPLAEIAIACRFSDQSHLTRVFSQATGLTPGRWRTERATARHAVA
jgi:AraC-like DNA-binding protein